MKRMGIGVKHGSLVLVSSVDRRIQGRVAGIFRCECGTEREYPLGRVKSGRVSHCGCKTNRKTNLRHGMRGSPEYSSWTAMKGRCLSPAHKDYPRYGAKGVRVCAEWVSSFEEFYAHIGPRPPGTTLDRIDTLGHYAPGNVRWASPRLQAENTVAAWSVELHGVKYPSLAAAARAFGVTETTVVRWCDGYTDPRRGRTTPPHSNCWRRRTYA